MYVYIRMYIRMCTHTRTRTRTCTHKTHTHTQGNSIHANGGNGRVERECDPRSVVVKDTLQHVRFILLIFFLPARVESRLSRCCMSALTCSRVLCLERERGTEGGREGGGRDGGWVDGREGGSVSG